MNQWSRLEKLWESWPSFHSSHTHSLFKKNCENSLCFSTYALSQIMTNSGHTVKILGLCQNKLHKGFYAKNGVIYIYVKMIFIDFEIICWEILGLFTNKVH